MVTVISLGISSYAVAWHVRQLPTELVTNNSAAAIAKRYASAAGSGVKYGYA
jgi:hypothetical protein